MNTTNNPFYKNNKLWVALMVVLTAVPFQAFAGPVSPKTAEQVARTFWNQHRDKDVSAQTSPMQQLEVRWDAFYLFAADGNNGFVIVAADDAVRPVLAYSFHNAAMRDSVGREMSWWLDGWQQQVEVCRQQGYKATSEVAGEWSRLLYGPAEPRPLTAVAPMVTTQWDQDEPYNDSCPSRSGWGGYAMHAATGCVATAMAQVMRYWSFPVRGIGTHTYYSQSISGWGQGFGQQTVDFGATVYDWENMPNTLTSVSSNAQKSAVATLMYHCGVAADMMYGTAFEGGSGAFIHNIPLLSYGHTLNGMIQFFGYSANATGMDRDHYTDSVWTAMVRGEIDARRPIIYAGGDESSGGHCFVCDGYDDEDRYHFNWGWSGAGDGYYTLNHLAPGIGGTGGGTGTYDFSNGQQMLVGIQPPAGDDTLCVIRHYPYTQDFETAPTCWSATTSNSSTSYSWMVYDTTGVDGNYSVLAMSNYGGTSNEHLLSPYIVTPGSYTVTWQARPLNASRPASYTMSVGSLQLLSDTVNADEWVSREVHFSLNEGDTIQLDFAYKANSSSPGVLIDNITIANSSSSAINEADKMQVKVYPNPTHGVVTVDAGHEIQRIDVLDLMGRTVFSTTRNTVDLSPLAAGIYMLRITSAGATGVQRVVLQSR